MSATIRLKTLRQLASVDPEPYCPSPTYVGYTTRLLDEGMVRKSQTRRGFHIEPAGRRELAKLEAILLRTTPSKSGMKGRVAA